MTILMLVESPAKAKTIGQYIGASYLVRATKGHLQDLPEDRLGVDVENGFELEYVILDPRLVESLRQSALHADELILASDPDREGEAIAWQASELLKREMGNRPIRRAVFHELTPQAIRAGLANTREINMRLVEAQQTRRAMDRLVGYTVSQVMWREFKPDGQPCPKGLSAGRVQTTALGIIVEREWAIRAFQKQTYWVIGAEFSAKDRPEARFRANLAEMNGRKVERCRDEATLHNLTDSLRQVQNWVVRGSLRIPVKKDPPPPYTSSSLQQDAVKRLQWSAKKTMEIAQELFEGLQIGGGAAVQAKEVGLITYPRTDSVQAAASAQDEARQVIAAVYGLSALPAKPPVYRMKTAHAQEAHEAIRPTSPLRRPERVAGDLNGDQLKLYTLIWQRFIASQMRPSVYAKHTLEVEGKGSRRCLLRISKQALQELGFLAVFAEEADDELETLPELSPGDELFFHGPFSEERATQPPEHFTEATLIQALEKEGIGRPSTYAGIVSTLKERRYLEKRNKSSLMPSPLGEQAVMFLMGRYPELLETQFTAEMENTSDGIANGILTRQLVLAPIVERLGKHPGKNAPTHSLEIAH